MPVEESELREEVLEVLGAIEAEAVSSSVQGEEADRPDTAHGQEGPVTKQLVEKVYEDPLLGGETWALLPERGPLAGLDAIPQLLDLRCPRLSPVEVVD